MKFHISLVIALFFGYCHSQESASIYLNTGTIPLENNIRGSETVIFQEFPAFRILTFHTIPNQDQKAALKSAGVELLNYLPKFSYYVRIAETLNGSDLMNAGVSGIHLIQSDFKLDANLLNNEIPEWSYSDYGLLKLDIALFSNLNLKELENKLNELSISIIHTHSPTFLTVELPKENLSKLLSIDEIYHIATIPPPAEPENIGGRLDHRSNSLAEAYASGLNYDGTGVTVMMQDDGYIGEHIDYTGRIDQSSCVGCSTDPNNDHGDHVAGTIMGAGNLDPMAKGMAFGADLRVFSSTNDNYDSVPVIYNNNEVVITSKSYSNGCNAGYTDLAAQLDQQIYSMPSLMHVFSAGNNGTADCAYGASGWGNITGGHKSGKNVITVGNLSQLDVLASSSSRGPATDGRIKPDICGVGTSVYSTVPGNNYDFKTGTSMSCPGIAGTVTQLYHAYKDLNGGANPPSGLIKAAVLNSAEDLGNPGPDFKHGYGRINGRRAYQLLENGNYLIDTISQGENDLFFINVPPGTSELKIMAYWADVEGTVGASFALVNDLNLKVKDPLNTLYEPWVLDHSPNAVSLDSDAVRGVDSLNNMEQVSIENPVSGSYEIDIFGDLIPQGPQAYFIVYQLLSDEITLTHPNGGEGIQPNNSCPIRWDASPSTEDFTLEYTPDDGQNWFPIGSALSNARLFFWYTPADTISGEMRVRISRGSTSDASDTLFSLMKIPTNLNVDWKCPDSMQFSWTATTGATGYEVSMLGAKYMDSAATVFTNTAVLQLNENVDTWLSVRALGPDGARSERAIAIHKEPGQYACVWSDPLALFSSTCDKMGVNGCVSLTNQSVNTDAGSNYLWYFPGGTPSTSSDINPTVCYDTEGLKDAALVVQNMVGTDSIYLADYLNVIGTLGLAYLEGFENYSNLSSTENWDVYNDFGAAFEVVSNAAHSGMKSVRLLNFGESADNMDELISGPIDLSGIDEGAGEYMTLSFRYSYRKADVANNEWLKVLVREACDENWATRKVITGNNLSEFVSMNSWVPSSEEDWTTVHIINVTSAYWTNDFQMKFQFTSDNGNNLYLDDINIYKGDPSDALINVGELDGFTISNLETFPNPTDNSLNIKFTSKTSEIIEINILDANGKVVMSRSITASPGSNLVFLDTETIHSGIYTVLLTSDSSSLPLRFIKL